MKLNTIFLAFSFCNNLLLLVKPANFYRFLVESEKYSLLSSAVVELINNVSTTEVKTVNLIHSESSNNVKDFDDEFLSKSFHFANFLILQESADRITKKMTRLRRFAVLEIKDFHEFSRINRKISRENFKFDGHYLIILIKGLIKEIHDIFTILWKFQIFNVNVLWHAGNNSVLVGTFKPFQVDNCNNTKLVLINEFKEGKFTKQIENMFPDKMRNLQSCPLQVAIPTDIRPFIIVSKSNGSLRVTGRNIKILSALSGALNFKVNYSFIGESGDVYENGSADGAWKEMLDGSSDFLPCSCYLDTESTLLDATTTLTFETIISAISPGKEFTAFEILICPFTLNLWFLVLAIVLIGVVIVIVIKRQPVEVQNFVFGRGVRNIYLNMLNGYLGGSQNSLPTRNFARFLLAFFLIYTLIMRTLYQGLYFEALHSGKRHKEVQSVDEMIEKNFKFYTPQYYIELIRGIGIARNRFVKL